MATWQDLLSQLFGGSPPISGSQSGGPMGAPMMPTPQLSPGSMTPPPSPSPSMWGGQGLGSLGLLNAGANMLTASNNPKTAGSLGAIVGQGVGGGIEGMGAGAQLQRLGAQTAGQQAQTAGQSIANRLGQQELAANESEAALRQKIYNHWMSLMGGAPAGAQPSAAMGLPKPPVMMGGGPAPTVPGAPPVPGPGVSGDRAAALQQQQDAALQRIRETLGGSQPLGGQPSQPNPFIQQMLARRMGMRA